MPQAFGNIVTVVRRKSNFDRTTEQYSEHNPSVYSGDRRTRQIGRRNWVCKIDRGWCTSGDVWRNKTRNNPPKKGEE